MPKSKWLVIAKNEYRLQTAFLKDFRRFLPIAAISLIFVFQLLLAPSIMNAAVDSFMALFLGQAAVALMEIMLFIISFYLFIFPITSSLKDVKPGQIEIILSTPVKPRDLLVGEFIGKMPVYAFGIAIFAGIFTTIMQPLGLDVLQLVVLNIVFITTLLIAFWIGTLIAALLRSRLGKSARGRDLGKALGFILALPLVAAMYAIMGGFLEGLLNPETSLLVQQILGIFPSSWGAEVIVSLTKTPGNIVASISQSGVYFVGLLGFFIGSLWLGGSVADKLYDLEPSSFGSSSVKPDGIFYKTVRSLGGGGRTGGLIASLFKDYGRRFENLTKVGYIIGIIIVMKVFLFQPEDLVDVMMPLLMLGPMIAGFVASDATLRGKECLFIYRKAPGGVNIFIKAKLIQSLMVVIPITLVISVVSLVTFPGISATDMLIQTVYSVILVSVNMVYALGIFLWNPVFSDNQTTQMINFQPLVFTTIISWILLRETLGGFFPGVDAATFEIIIIIAHLGITCVLAIFTMIMGRRKLNNME